MATKKPLKIEAPQACQSCAALRKQIDELQAKLLAALAVPKELMAPASVNDAALRMAIAQHKTAIWKIGRISPIDQQLYRTAGLK